MIIYIDLLGGVIELSLFFFLKQPPFLSWICLQIQESATNDDLISIYYFKKKIHFIPDSQGIIAKELSLIEALQIHPALRYSDEIPLYYYYYY